MGDAIFVDPDARIALVFRAKGVAQKRRALVAKVVFTAIGGGVPFSAFQQDNAKAGGGEFLGDDAACCA